MSLFYKKIKLDGFAESIFLGINSELSRNTSTRNIKCSRNANERSGRNFQCPLFFVWLYSSEMIYVRISLIGVSWIRKQKKLIKWLEWVTLAIVIALAIGSFVAAGKNSNAKNVMLNNDMNRFILGLLLSAINPAQIPFWLGWSTILFTKNILKPNNTYYYLYISGIGIGSILGNCVFIFGGKYIVEELDANMNLLNWIIGGIFSLAALIQLIKIMWHKDAAQKLNNFDEHSKT